MVGELHPIERKITLTPLLAPLLDHERKKFGILIGATRVGFALIPNRVHSSLIESFAGR